MKISELIEALQREHKKCADMYYDYDDPIVAVHIGDKAHTVQWLAYGGGEEEGVGQRMNIFFIGTGSPPNTAS